MPEKRVIAQAPGKVNLLLKVGPLGADGYHPLVNVFQAVNLFETVTAAPRPSGSGIGQTVSGPGAAAVPLDHTNLAHKAATALAAHIGRAPDVALHLQKGVPVAGGMAGGSADAAATLVACNELWGAKLSLEELLELGAELGSDVPFSILGGTAVGTGRGHLLTPILDAGTYHWALASQAEGLSTPAVFRKFDDLTPGRRSRSDSSRVSKPTGDIGDVRLVDQLPEALAAGDPAALATLLTNDLQPAALALRPELASTIQVALASGALASIVSGSGPTVAALAASPSQAEAIAAAWRTHQVAASSIVTTAPAPGARILKRAR